MNIKEMKLPQVILILGLLFMILTAVVILTIYDKDAAGVYAFGGTILVALGIVAGVTGQVASNTNGNTSKMLEMMAEDRRVATQMAQNTATLLTLLSPASPAAEQKVIELASAGSMPPIQVPPDAGGTVAPPERARD